MKWNLRLVHLWPLMAYVALVTFSMLYVPVEYISIATPFIGVVGATLYMVMFATRNWQDDQFTRAMMLQAFTIWLLFLLGVIRLSLTGKPSIHGSDGELLGFFAISFNELILISVWYKTIALFRQIREGYLDELDSSPPRV